MLIQSHNTWPEVCLHFYKTEGVMFISFKEKGIISHSPFICSSAMHWQLRMNAASLETLTLGKHIGMP